MSSRFSITSRRAIPSSSGSGNRKRVAGWRRTTNLMLPELPRHYRIQKIAESLGVDSDTARRYFAGVDGVVEIKHGKKRTLLVPEDVYQRFLDAHTIGRRNK